MNVVFQKRKRIQSDFGVIIDLSNTYLEFTDAVLRILMNINKISIKINGRLVKREKKNVQFISLLFIYIFPFTPTIFFLIVRYELQNPSHEEIIQNDIETKHILH